MAEKDRQGLNAAAGARNSCVLRLALISGVFSVWLGSHLSVPLPLK